MNWTLDHVLTITCKYVQQASKLTEMIQTRKALNYADVYLHPIIGYGYHREVM